MSIKSTFLIFLLSLGLNGFSQVHIDTHRIGPFTVGKSLEDINEEAGTNISFSAEDNVKFDFSRKVVITGVEYRLVFQDYYNMNGTFMGKRLYSVSVSNDIFKTAEEIGVGSTREEIIAAYGNSDICIYSNWDETTGKRIPQKTSISVDYVDGNNPGGYLFELENNKVIEVMINASYQDETKG